MSNLMAPPAEPTEPSAENLTASPAPAPHRGWWIVASTTILLIAIVFVGAAWAWVSLAQPLHGSATPTTFKVQPGEGARTIAERLEADGYVRSKLALLAYLTVTGDQFIEGIYYLQRGGSSLANVEPVLTGTVAERQVTIPEGLRVHEIAQLLEQNMVVTAHDVTQAARYNPSLVTLPTNYNLKSDTFLEGFLFPDTYRLPVDATAEEVVTRLVTTYLSRTKAVPLTYEQLILASIVEREAKFDADRPLIAGVYANRLKLGMALQADPTVQYAKANARHGCSDDLTGCVTENLPEADEGWWPTLTVADYQAVESEYNSYRIRGLPPRPITNPGLASIAAAANPTDHDYLYFITDAEGHAHFAKTLEEHNRNKVEFLR